VIPSANFGLDRTFEFVMIRNCDLELLDSTSPGSPTSPLFCARWLVSERHPVAASGSEDVIKADIFAGVGARGCQCNRLHGAGLPGYERHRAVVHLCVTNGERL
jgi:hypothetical protein